MGYGQQAGGTHATGMDSCCYYLRQKKKIRRTKCEKCEKSSRNENVNAVTSVQVCCRWDVTLFTLLYLSSICLSSFLEKNGKCCQLNGNIKPYHNKNAFQ